jgi:hypothetical protein
MKLEEAMKTMEFKSHPKGKYWLELVKNEATTGEALKNNAKAMFSHLKSNDHLANMDILPNLNEAESTTKDLKELVELSNEINDFMAENAKAKAQLKDDDEIGAHVHTFANRVASHAVTWIVNSIEKLEAKFQGKNNTTEIKEEPIDLCTPKWATANSAAWRQPEAPAKAYGANKPVHRQLNFYDKMFDAGDVAAGASASKLKTTSGTNGLNPGSTVPGINPVDVRRDEFTAFTKQIGTTVDALQGGITDLGNRFTDGMASVVELKEMFERHMKNNIGRATFSTFNEPAIGRNGREPEYNTEPGDELPYDDIEKVDYNVRTRSPEIQPAEDNRTIRFNPRGHQPRHNVDEGDDGHGERRGANRDAPRGADEYAVNARRGRDDAPREERRLYSPERRRSPEHRRSPDRHFNSNYRYNDESYNEGTTPISDHVIDNNTKTAAPEVPTIFKCKPPIFPKLTADSNLDAHFAQLERYFRLSQVPSFAQIDFALLSIPQYADWWDSYYMTRDTSIPVTWQMFKDTMKSFIMGQSPAQTAMSRLLNLRQGTFSAEKYAKMFLNLVRQSNTVPTENWLVHHFLMNLTDVPMRRLLTANKGIAWSNLTTLIQHMSDLLSYEVKNAGDSHRQPLAYKNAAQRPAFNKFKPKTAFGSNKIPHKAQFHNKFHGHRAGGRNGRDERGPREEQPRGARPRSYQPAAKPQINAVNKTYNRADKHCILCAGANMQPHVVKSHNVEKCGFLEKHGLTSTDNGRGMKRPRDY